MNWVGLAKSSLIGLGIASTLYMMYRLWPVKKDEKKKDEAKNDEKKKPTMVTKSVNYFIARECNYQCRFCFHTDLGKGHVEKLPRVQEAMRLLRATGMEKMNVSGGEPFLQPKLLGEICKFCKTELPPDAEGKGVFVGIVSNGSKITEEWLQEYGQYVDMIAVSLDSADNDTNIHIGRDETGNHINSTRRAAQLIKKHGIQFKMNSVVTAQSWQEDMNWFIDELKPKRWKVFQALPIEGENWGDGQHNGRDASDLWITEEQYKAFCDRHRHQPNIVIETNETMKDSYLLLDEELRFLNCRGGKKVPSKCILDVGVQAALEENEYFDAEAFYRRDGDFYRAKQNEEDVRDIEDTIPSAASPKSTSGAGTTARPNSRQTLGMSNATGNHKILYSHADSLEVLQELQYSKPKWWTTATDRFVADVEAAAPPKNKTARKAKLHPIVLVEGIDGTGKSTVTKALAKELSPDATVIATPNAKYEEIRAQFRSTKTAALTRAFYMGCNYIAAQEIALAAEKGPVVVDRWWYSTFAYNQAPSAAFPEPEELVWPSDLLEDGITSGFLLSVSEEERLRRVQRRSESDPNSKQGEEVFLANDPERREKIMKIYRAFTTPKLTEIDTTDLPIEEVVSKIKAMI